MKNLHVLLTGSTGGIGQAIAKKIVSEGADITLVCYDESKLTAQKAVLQDTANSDQYINYQVANLLDAASIQNLAEQVKLNSNPVNTLINCAGMNEFAMFEDLSASQIQRIMQLNSISPITLTHALLPHFKNQSSANIINIGSTFGTIAYPGFGVYSASKYAMRGFSQALSRELSDTNIKVKYLSPRATATPLNAPNVVAMNKALKVAMDTPEKVANELWKLMHSKRQQSVIGWPEKLFAWINQIAPSVVSKSIAKQLPTIRKFAKT